MNDNSAYYTDLITRYFSGEIAGDELRLLSDWLKSDPQHQELFREYQKTWQLIEKYQVASKVNIDQEWIDLQAKLSTATTNVVEPQVIPISQKRNREILFLGNSWRIAASVIILLTCSFLLYFYFSKPSSITITAQAGNLEQVLPDGSEVTLHTGSQLSYPAHFESGKRNVELKGEAYFKVAHDITKPFIVTSGDARVEVLGTQFNVNTHSAVNLMEVVLTSGKVKVYNQQSPTENVVLAPGEKAILDAGAKHISKTANSDVNYMAWKTHVLVFDNESLAEVVTTLQNVYETPISLANPQLDECRFTASFNGQSLESVLQVLKETLDLKVKTSGKTIEISGKSCN
jgi:ferric-dicitrate binding protein FerR (iron transport regulator)